MGPEVEGAGELAVAEVVAEPSPAPPPAPARVKPPAKGTLALDTSPWTTVYFGRTALGETPLNDVPLPAGRHRLRLVNETRGVEQVIEVEIKPGQRTVKRLKF